ncbi:tyrosine-type recombinase/integrase [Lactiplantibacillus dongliensis]|uniref:Tyrosine-type recombinase/integrase n=1 Tax=Lactiplantibacillus dongliensis TaxID=2559919 RepID=A0ABW1R8C6_9LACO|nr:site-specific integrase [Lactiplantibacillus dongliensis]
MHFEKRTRKSGTVNVAIESFTDPLTGKRRRATVVFESGTPRAKAQARRELDDKISSIIDDLNKTQDEKIQNYTFGELQEAWFKQWTTTVKPQTVQRELLVINRLSKLIADDILIKKITPLMVKQCLDDYRQKYHSTFSTMQHIKSTFNKIFDYAVLYNILPFSPSQVVKLRASVDEKIAKKERLNDKFLNAAEIKALISELKKRRNPSYLDLALFLLGTGCRIGEAAALTVDSIDFQKKTVTIDRSLQSHDLTVDNYYLDTTKTPAGERVEELPDFVIEALKRSIERNKMVDQLHSECPSDAFHFSKVIFRTEYGSPITSHSFRELLSRISSYLRKNCEAVYGFKWTKNVVPHSFRHIHVSILRSDSSISLKEVQERVGHVEEETTDGYTHRFSHSQAKSVKAVDAFADKIGITN